MSIIDFVFAFISYFVCKNVISPMCILYYNKWRLDCEQSFLAVAGDNCQEPNQLWSNPLKGIILSGMDCSMNLIHMYKGVPFHIGWESFAMLISKWSFVLRSTGCLNNVTLNNHFTLASHNLPQRSHPLTFN